MVGRGERKKVLVLTEFGSDSSTCLKIVYVSTVMLSKTGNEMSERLVTDIFLYERLYRKTFILWFSVFKKKREKKEIFGRQEI